MPNAQLLEKLLQTFRQEAAEHLETLNGALLQYEQATRSDDRQARIQDGFRAAHSLKGAARAVSLDAVQTVAHAMESVFQHVRDDKAVLEPGHCDTLYDAVDVIEQLIMDGDTPINGVLEKLHAIAAEAAPAAIEPQPEPAPMLQPTEADETIRVPLVKLDDLMAEVGELLVARISTAQRLTETHDLSQVLAEWSKSWTALKPILKRKNDPQLTEVLMHHADTMHAVIDRFQHLEGHTRRDVTRLDMVTDTLQNKVRRVRMIPFSVHQLTLERVVRDAARVEGKTVRFEVIGSETELDKRVLEGLKAPLIHLLRNAVGHGIEPADERGDKPPVGCVTLQVWQRGSEVHISVSDDGRGFQLDAIQQAYQQRYGDTDHTDIVQMAFMPGITTASEVNAIAGRGIGLDVVREALERIHGRFSVQSDPGSGTTIHLIVPTSLAITRMLLVRAAGTQYALPLVTVEKIIQPDALVTVGNKSMLRINGHNMPISTLTGLLGIAAPTVKNELALVISVGDQRLAVLVDDVLTEQELAVKPLGFPVRSLQNITGAALLGTGVPVIVLNPSDFIASYRNGYQPPTPVETPKLESTITKTRVLVVDDSITTRTLERNILEAAGFDVLTATNGLEALSHLSQHHMDVVVSDIEMPQMDGFELTERIRESDKFNHLPVILVTSLERDADKERGMLAGADAYIVKRGFDQAELLATIDRLI